MNKLPTILIGVLFITSCGINEPSEGDINSVMTNKFDEVEHVKKLSCKPAAGEPGFICEVRTLYKQDSILHGTEHDENYRFFYSEADKNWIVRNYE
jgi:hypothetical protein